MIKMSINYQVKKNEYKLKINTNNQVKILLFNPDKISRKLKISLK